MTTPEQKPDKKPFETTSEGAPKLQPTEARQAEVVFDTKKKRRRYYWVVGAALLVFVLAYLYAAPS